MLKELGGGLSYAEEFVTFYGVKLQTRMTVVALPDGGLLIISPLVLTERLKRELDGLGPVRHVASPNKIHNQGLASFAAAYPDAMLWASPGLPERRPDLAFAGILDDRPHPDWAPVLDQQVTRGNLFFAEVVFLHAASKTLIVADLVENICQTTLTSKVARLMAKTIGIFGKPLPSPEFRMYTTDAEAAGAAINGIGAWAFERILMAHGAIVTDHAHEVLADVRDFLLAEVASRSSFRAKLYRFLASRQ